MMADDSRVNVNFAAKIMRLDASSKEQVEVFLDLNKKTFNILEKMMLLRPLAGDGGRLK